MVPANNILDSGKVPANNVLEAGTVPANNDIQHITTDLFSWFLTF